LFRSFITHNTYGSSLAIEHEFSVEDVSQIEIPGFLVYTLAHVRIVYVKKHGDYWCRIFDGTLY